MLGDLASREVCPGDELQVMLLHDGWESSESKRIGRLFEKTLNQLTQNSLIFSPMRRDANSVLSFSVVDLVDHFEKSASSEIPILTRSRFVFEYGDFDIRDRFNSARSELLAEFSKDDSLISRFMESLNTPEKSENPTYVGMRGGLSDVETTARYIQMTTMGSDSDEEVRTAESIFRRHGNEALCDAAALWRSLHGVARLVHEDGVELNAMNTKSRSLIASACGLDDFDALISSTNNIAARAATEIDAVVKR